MATSSTTSEQSGQPDTLHALCNRLGLLQGMAYDNYWSAAPDFLQLIVDHVLKEKPETIVECGCGVTTLMLARCCELNGRGQVFSLENGIEFAVKTRSEIARYGLEKFATVLDAPLMERVIDNTAYQWYAHVGLPVQGIDMLVIDGPSGYIQRHSRYPALPLLFDKLAGGCVIFLDDAARPDEREVVTIWQERFPGIEHEYVTNERGCSILRVRKMHT